jgi:hypothetical protein
VLQVLPRAIEVCEHAGFEFFLEAFVVEALADFFSNT